MDRTSDIVLVGGGIAGILLADHLTRSGTLHVTLLEAGGDTVTDAMQATYEAELAGLPYTGHLEGRFRAFGGSSLRWGGGVFPFRPIDFESRDWVPGSGWPVGLSDIESYYPALFEAFGLNGLPYDAQFLNHVEDEFPEFDRSKFVFRFAKWAPFDKRNIAQTVGREIATRKNLSVLKESNVVAIELDPSGKTVDHLVVARPDGSRFAVRARHFVLCGGGIEVPRLLLASTSVNPRGVGNDRDVVGRYYQDHFSVFAGVAVPNDRKAFLSWAEPYFRNKVRHSLKIELADEAQRSERVLNGHAHFVFFAPEDSGFNYVRSRLRNRQAGSGQVAKVSLPTLIGDIADLGRLAVHAKLNQRRGAPKRCELRVLMDLEQAPNPESRITLTDKRDAFGMPRIRLDWRAGELEHKTLQTLIRLFDGEWKRLGLGRVDWKPQVSTDEWTTLMADAFHHSGATRMGTDPATSVVDPDLRVHGVDNLSIASASVLPTNSGSGPTMTMLALALRLKDRLLTLD